MEQFVVSKTDKISLEWEWHDQIRKKDKNAKEVEEKLCELKELLAKKKQRCDSEKKILQDIESHLNSEKATLFYERSKLPFFEDFQVTYAISIIQDQQKYCWVISETGEFFFWNSTQQLFLDCGYVLKSFEPYYDKNKNELWFLEEEEDIEDDQTPKEIFLCQVLPCNGSMKLVKRNLSKLIAGLLEKSQKFIFIHDDLFLVQLPYNDAITAVLMRLDEKNDFLARFSMLRSDVICDSIGDFPKNQVPYKAFADQNGKLSLRIISKFHFPLDMGYSRFALKVLDYQIKEENASHEVWNFMNSDTTNFLDIFYIYYSAKEDQDYVFCYQKDILICFWCSKSLVREFNGRKVFIREIAEIETQVSSNQLFRIMEFPNPQEEFLVLIFKDKESMTRLTNVSLFSLKTKQVVRTKDLSEDFSSLVVSDQILSSSPGNYQIDFFDQDLAVLSCTLKISFSKLSLNTF